MKKPKFSKWILRYKFHFLIIPLFMLLTWLLKEYHVSATINNDVWEIFFNVFGMLYAVIAGLILVEEFKRYGDLYEDVELELNALQDIRDYLVYMDEKKKTPEEIQLQKRAKKKILLALMEYSASIIGKDWKGMEKTCDELDTDTTGELNDLIKAVHELQVTNKSDQVGLEQIMILVSEITTLRTQRIALAYKKIPTQLSALINIMGIVLVISVTLLNVNSLELHLFVTAASSGVILIIYLLFQDLANPFVGQWNIPKEGFFRFMARLYLLIETRNIADMQKLDELLIMETDRETLVYIKQQKEIEKNIASKRTQKISLEEIQIFND